VAADNLRTRDLLKAAAVGHHVDGVPVDAVELPVTAIVHVDRTNPERLWLLPCMKALSIRMLNTFYFLQQMPLFARALDFQRQRKLGGESV
jgi:hypothetical protein